MKQSRHSSEQITRILREADAEPNPKYYPVFLFLSAHYLVITAYALVVW